MPTFDTAALLRQVTQRPVLGSVSKLVDPASISQAQRGELPRSARALGGLIVVFGAWLAWVSMLSRA